MCIDFDLQNRLDQFYFGFLLKGDVEKLEKREREHYFRIEILCVF